MTVIYEATEDRPHYCTTAADGLPVGSICRCDCGRFWLRKTVIGDYWVYRWVPVRWYHRQARRRIKEWVRQKNNGDFRFPMTSLLTAAPPQTLTNKEVRPPVSPGQSCCDCGHEKSLHQALTMLENTRRGRCLAASGCGCESYHDINALYPAWFPVHNHGPEEGAGLACRESFVGGRLIGQCMQDKETP